MMNVRIYLFLSLGLAFGASARAAFADEACKADLEKFCKTVKPGGGRILACLKAHEPDLSKACRERMTERKEAVHRLHDTCRADVEKHCKDVKPGGGRILACLKSHENDLSKACQTALTEVQKAKRK